MVYVILLRKIVWDCSGHFAGVFLLPFLALRKQANIFGNLHVTELMAASWSWCWLPAKASHYQSMSSTPPPPPLPQKNQQQKTKFTHQDHHKSGFLLLKNPIWPHLSSFETHMRPQIWPTLSLKPCENLNLSVYKWNAVLIKLLLPAVHTK